MLKIVKLEQGCKIIFFAILLALTSCKTVEYRIEHRNKERIIHSIDTILINSSDSVIIEKEKDTTFITKIKYRDLIKTKMVIDTIQTNDTIYITRNATKPIYDGGSSSTSFYIYIIIALIAYVFIRKIVS